MEMVGKMKSTNDSAVGARIASVHNGSSLFTGDAGSGESNIRRHIIENDMLDTIIQLPNNLFYNTGITTYIWLLTNAKPEARRGKVQLIDANLLFRKLRGNRDGDPETDPLDEIIRSFNERWFQGWSATPEEQRVKFINIVNSIRAHPDYSAKYEANADPFNRGLALEKMLQDVMLKRRKDELELYKLFASDPAFKAAWSQNIEQVLNKNLDNRPRA
jgi:type I restriction-modification system DNA methylase subunit